MALRLSFAILTPLQVLRFQKSRLALHHQVRGSLTLNFWGALARYITLYKVYYEHLHTLSKSGWTWLRRNCTCVLDIILQKGKETQDETKTCDVDIETGIESRHGTWVGFFHGCNTLPMLQPCNHYTVTTQCANVRWCAWSVQVCTKPSKHGESFVWSDT